MNLLLAWYQYPTNLHQFLRIFLRKYFHRLTPICTPGVWSLSPLFVFNILLYYSSFEFFNSVIFKLMWLHSHNFSFEMTPGILFQIKVELFVYFHSKVNFSSWKHVSLKTNVSSQIMIKKFAAFVAILVFLREFQSFIFFMWYVQ